MIEEEVKAYPAMPFVEQMDRQKVYVITVQNKIKNTVTGYYVSHDSEFVTLLDKKDNLRLVSIERIIRINYYIDGREPF